MPNQPLRHVVASSTTGEDGMQDGDAGSGMHGEREKNDEERSAAAIGESIRGVPQLMSGVLQLESKEISENGDHAVGASFGFGNRFHGFSDKVDDFLSAADSIGGRRVFAFTLLRPEGGRRGRVPCMA